MTAQPSRDADEMLLLRMMEQDEEALAELLRLYVAEVNGYLIKLYGNVLSNIEIQVAINEAAFRVWRHASKCNLDRAPIRGWFLKIAKNEAIRLIEQGEQFVPFDENAHGWTMDDCQQEETEADRKTKRRIKLLDYIVERKLVGLQQNIIKEDIAAGDKADNARLATKYGKTENNIHASRHKARDNIAKHMAELERNPPSPGEML